MTVTNYSMESTKKENKTKIVIKRLVRQLSLKRRKDSEIRPIHTVRGHFSLTEIRGAKFPGRQTAATSLCALLQATTLCPSSWSAEVIDRLLLQGDKLHSTRVRHLTGRKTGPERGFLKPEHLPTQFSAKHTEFILAFEKLNPYDSPQGSSKQNQSGNLLEMNHVQTTLKTELAENSYGALLSVGADTVAVFTDNTYYYIFDPCEKMDAISMNSTRSVLLKFRDLSHLVKYVFRMMSKANTDMSVSVTRVHVTIKFDIWTRIAFPTSLCAV